MPAQFLRVASEGWLALLFSGPRMRHGIYLDSMLASRKLYLFDWSSVVLLTLFRRSYVLSLIFVALLSGYFLWANKQAARQQCVIEGLEGFRYTL